METFERYPGLAGLFIGSILSASLSTVSSGINSVTTVFIGVIYKRTEHSKLKSGRNEALVSQMICKFFVFKYKP